MASTRPSVPATYSDDHAFFSALANTSQEDARNAVMQNYVHMRVAMWKQDLEQQRALQGCGNANDNSLCLQNHVLAGIETLLDELLRDPKISQGVQITLCPSVWYASIPILTQMTENKDTQLCVESLKEAFNATELAGQYYHLVMGKLWDLQNQLMVTDVRRSTQEIIELEDELAQWQMVSVMYSVSADHSAAIAAATAAEPAENVESSVMNNYVVELQTELLRYNTQSNFMPIFSSANNTWKRKMCRHHS